MLVAGLDGTKKGWVCVTFDGAEAEAFGAGSFEEALSLLAAAVFVAVDMPIGFREQAIPGGRECERRARAMMPGRTSSVFSSPCRAALEHVDDYRRASEANRSSAPDGVGLSKQSHAIFRKMRELDAILTPELQSRVFEVHPEASFTELAAQSSAVIRASKKTSAGAAQRLALLDGAGLRVAPLVEQRRLYGAGADDVLDAAVAAWTAFRRAHGAAFCLPEQPPLDARGLRMEIWI